MFGYIVINQEELKMREYKRYRSFYCGVCRALEKRHGKKGKITLSYDAAFLAILLNGLYELPLTEEQHFCMTHPLKKQDMVSNVIVDYAADMGILLTYYKLLDDWTDEHDSRSRALAKSFAKDAERVATDWPKQSEAVKKAIADLSAYEKSGQHDLDEVSAFTGEMMGEIFLYKEDEWAPYLRRMGFYLGKFLYLLDAFDDLEKDRKKGCYNPWEPYEKKKDFPAFVENTLTMMMASCASDFEKLPILQDAELLRNILYSGVWIRFNEAVKRRSEKGDRS